jgi:hypothetical protein
MEMQDGRRGVKGTGRGRRRGRRRLWRNIIFD